MTTSSDLTARWCELAQPDSSVVKPHPELNGWVCREDPNLGTWVWFDPLTNHNHANIVTERMIELGFDYSEHYDPTNRWHTGYHPRGPEFDRIAHSQYGWGADRLTANLTAAIAALEAKEKSHEP